MDILPNLIWPTVVQCIFIASLHGGPDPSTYGYQPIAVQPSSCTFLAYIREETFVLEKNFHRVEIPIPSKEGWHNLHYSWGASYATLDHQQLAVRMGPTGSY